MTVWESGRESALLDDIIVGRKTIEGRLNRNKFSKYKPGDHVWLRRDYRDEDGGLREGESRQVLVEVVAIRRYQSFLDMVTTEGFEKVIPHASTREAAAAEYEKYYSLENQTEYGVLAIEFRLLSPT